MLAIICRIRSLAVLVMVCVIGGPTVSALCVHEMPAEMPVEAPCHEAGDAMMGGMDMEPVAPAHHDSETACLSACCAALDAPDTIAVTAPSTPASVIVTEREVWQPVVVTTAPPSGTRAHPPPGPHWLEIGRLLI